MTQRNRVRSSSAGGVGVAAAAAAAAAVAFLTTSTSIGFSRVADAFVVPVVVPSSSSWTKPTAVTNTREAAGLQLQRVTRTSRQPCRNSRSLFRSSSSSSSSSRLVRSSSDDSFSFGDDGGLDNLSPPDRKVQLSRYYRGGQGLFGAIGLLLLLMPDRTMTTMLASKCGGAAGYGMASGLCYILENANDNDRLSSDTYKRLNLGLLGFCLLGLLAVPGEAAFLPAVAPTLALAIVTTSVKLYGTVVSYLGWKRGISTGSTSFFLDDETGSVAVLTEVKKLGRELYSGAQETLKGLVVQNKKKALTYRNCLLLVSFGVVSAVMEGLFNIRYRTTFHRSWFEISLQASAVARLFMVSTMIYSLKDAAERDRLTGTTFIQLNVLVGVWAALVGLGQSIYPLGFALYRGVEMFAFSMPFLLKALKSQKQKDDQEKERSSK